MNRARRCVARAILALPVAIANAQEAATVPAPARQIARLVDIAPDAHPRLVYLGPVEGLAPRECTLRIENPTDAPLRLVKSLGKLMVRRLGPGREPQTVDYSESGGRLPAIQVPPRSAWTLATDAGSRDLDDARFAVHSLAQDGGAWLCTQMVPHPATIPIPSSGAIRLCFVGWQREHAWDTPILRLENPTDEPVEYSAYELDPETITHGLGPASDEVFYLCGFGKQTVRLPAHRAIAFQAAVSPHESEFRLGIRAGGQSLWTELIARPDRFLALSAREANSTEPLISLTEFAAPDVNERHSATLRISNPTFHPLAVRGANLTGSVELWTGAAFEPRELVFQSVMHRKPPVPWQSFGESIARSPRVEIPPGRAFEFEVDRFVPGFAFRAAVDVLAADGSSTPLWSPRFESPEDEGAK